MAVLVRPAVWSYDLELLRAAARDEDQLEAMLAAVALEDEDIWVAERAERPAGFAWGRRQSAGLHVLLLFIPAAEDAVAVLRALVERLIEELSGVGLRGAQGSGGIEIPRAAIRGADEQALRSAGLVRAGESWTVAGE